MRRRLTQILAGLSLVIITWTGIAPHTHGADLEWSVAPGVGEVHITRCGTQSAGIPHLHRDRVRQVDVCVACLRQHIQAIAAKGELGTPQTLSALLTIAAWVANTHVVRFKKSSRAPPILAS
jgi:hypothetical protein